MCIETSQVHEFYAVVTLSLVHTCCSRFVLTRAALAEGFAVTRAHTAAVSELSARPRAEGKESAHLCLLWIDRERLLCT